MDRILTFIIALFVLGVSSEVSAQNAGPQKLSMAAGPQATALAAALDKNKYKKKENKYVNIEIYIDIKNEPAAKSAPEYSGVYDCDGYKFDLNVSADGIARGSGYDSANHEGFAKSNFTLKDARVDGALLTGTKVYENGSSETFEAVFVNRTVTSGKNADNITDRRTFFGLGFIQGGKEWRNRVFLEKQD